MEILKVNFGSFWPGFDNSDNYFTRILSRKYKVVISEDPDLYFFTHNYSGKREYLKYKCHKVFLGWENERADWNCCDYVLDSDYYITNPRHKRWPIWAAWNIDKLVIPKEPEHFKAKEKFACMVVSNANARERIEFFKELSKYKKVDSGGRYMNNIGGPVDDKMNFIKKYKFVISFENSSYPGYTTEKLIEPMLVNSIPIYWGNPRVSEDFNVNSFIDVHCFSSFKKVVEYVIALDNDEELYTKKALEPWFSGNRIPLCMTQNSLAEYFDFIIEDMRSKPPVSASLWKYSAHRVTLAKKTVFRKVKNWVGSRPVRSIGINYLP
jgi:hypothetical protein